ncbi:MAG: zf-HC2 domain-containing protein [Candidatus Omnitrophica bacterium]|nr:zf-HC2 domain-containing protein [Candidatus Omnitrophota bacterium]MBU2265852.1 zf-HC2 domain-containing protein [Candidatus Omnitrophota bacterium]
MDCQEIKGVIPKYFNHTATDEEIKLVEEHLCVCHDCRSTLGELMDKLAIPEESKPEQTSQNADIEYVPGEGIDIELPESSQEAAPIVTETPQEAASNEPEPVAASQPANQQDNEILPDIPADKNERSSVPPLPAEDKVVENTEPAVVESLNEPEPENLEPKLSEPLPDETSERKESYSLDKLPLEKEKSDIFEYVILVVGIVIFLIFVYLFVKGRSA